MRKYYPVIVLFILFCGSGCGREPSKRTYQEIVVDSPQKTSWQGTEDPHASFRGIPAKNPMAQGTIPDGLLNSRADVPLLWQKPDTWQEFPGSGFRLVTFKAGEGEDAVETSIVSLSGAAGGINANLSRWMQQINLEIPAEANLQDFLKQQNAYVSETSIDFIDFSRLQKDLPATSPSMYASIVQFPDSTVFVKMTGTISAVAKHKDEFLSLSKSVTLKK